MAKKELTEEQREKRREIRRIHYLKHKGKISEKHNLYYLKHKKETLIKRKEYQSENKEMIRKRRANRYIENKEEVLNKARAYRLKNKIIISYKRKIYRLKHKHKIRNQRIKNRAKTAEYTRNKFASDPNYKIMRLLRNRIRSVIKGFSKSAHTMELIGCDIDFIKNHLQQTAIKNGYLDFDINNWSGKEYHLDHIIPCFIFDMSCPVHQHACFNWRNLQILSAYDNDSKGNKFCKFTPWN